MTSNEPFCWVGSQNCWGIYPCVFTRGDSVCCSLCDNWITPAGVKSLRAMAATTPRVWLFWWVAAHFVTLLSLAVTVVSCDMRELTGDKVTRTVCCLVASTGSGRRGRGRRTMTTSWRGHVLLRHSRPPSPWWRGDPWRTGVDTGLVMWLGWSGSSQSIETSWDRDVTSSSCKDLLQAETHWVTTATGKLRHVSCHITSHLWQHHLVTSARPHAVSPGQRDSPLPGVDNRVWDFVAILFWSTLI